MKRKVRFDALELVLISAALVVATMVVTLRSFAILDGQTPYRERYGAKVSDGPEEWIVRDFFGDEHGGIFVDVGAAHYREKSNTYRLETALGWSGVAIDAQAHYAADYRAHRPRTTFVPAFVSDRVGTVDFYVPAHNPGVASADRGFVDGVDRVVRTDRLPTVTLTQLLDRVGITTIDYLSMDIEREEPKALAGFDLGRFKPRLVCIEAHVPVRQQIINYFASREYVVVGKYWTVDGANLYFMPAP